MSFKNKKIFHYFLLLILLVGLFSCVRKEIITKELTNKRFRICKVAIFPFYNLTEKEKLSDILVQMFTIDMVREGIEVVEPGLVKNFLFRERILNPLYIKTETLKKFKYETKVDVVIGGQIIKASQVGDNVKLSLLIWARDTSTGDFIWYTFYKRNGENYRKVFHFGKISSLSALAQRMVEEIIKDWENRGFFKCGK